MVNEEDVGLLPERALRGKHEAPLPPRATWRQPPASGGAQGHGRGEEEFRALAIERHGPLPLAVRGGATLELCRGHAVLSPCRRS